MKTVTLLIAATVCILPTSLEAQNATVKWFALSGGFAVTSVQSGRMLMMSEGQSFVEAASGTLNIVESGFLVHPALRDILVSVPYREELPISFALSQNYPNPFNPTTNIRFEIPQVGFVSLKVYDLLGREVTTLLNEKLNPGRYERSFNGKGLASGVYFYRLTAGTFTAIKKMLLLQ